MNIGGFVKNSFVDYPGLISSVIFTNGCNYNCWYCHNKSLINSGVNQVDFNEIINFLETRKGLIDAVVFSGGEATLQNDLEEKIIQIKNMEFRIKLDTNGTNPRVLKNLLDKNLLDYVAMDVKTSIDNYEQIVQSSSLIENVLESIKILIDSKIDYEFRTTLSPDINEENIKSICYLIKDCKRYYLQKCNLENQKGYSKEELLNLLEVAKSIIPSTELRNL